MAKNLPGLKNFYMAGQWVEVGGGLPAVAISGRDVVQIICKRDKKRFVTMAP
jgi:phytoene dehydrogenase-like protein